MHSQAWSANMNCSVDAVLVRPEHNRAVSLTREAQRWLDLIKKTVEPPYFASVVSPSENDFD